MANNQNIQLTRGTTNKIINNTTNILDGQPVVDTTKNTLLIGNGTNQPKKLNLDNEAELGVEGRTPSEIFESSDNVNRVKNATQAIKDESGNNIKSTYATNISIENGRTIQLKNKNGELIGDNVTISSVAQSDSATRANYYTDSDGSQSIETIQEKFDEVQQELDDVKADMSTLMIYKPLDNAGTNKFKFRDIDNVKVGQTIIGSTRYVNNGSTTAEINIRTPSITSIPNTKWNCCVWLTGTTSVTPNATLTKNNLDGNTDIFETSINVFSDSGCNIVMICTRVE